MYKKHSMGGIKIGKTLNLTKKRKTKLKVECGYCSLLFLRKYDESQNEGGNSEVFFSKAQSINVSSHTDAIHIGAMEIDGSRMTLPR